MKSQFHPQKLVSNLFSSFFGFLYNFSFNLFEPIFLLGQKLLGFSRLGWLFVFPNLFIFGIFCFLPIIINVWFATTGGVQLMPTNRPYVGGENFAVLLECRDYFDISTCRKDIFWRSMLNTAYFSIIQVVLIVFFSLLTAIVLNKKIIGRGFWRGVFFYPVLLSPVVVALIWKWLLINNGVFNAGLIAAGYQSVDWLTDGNWAFFWSVFVSIWARMGFYTLILLAGLQAIPKDLYEAAEMDATKAWRTFYRITLPLLMPNMIVVLLLSMIRAVQIFDEVFVLTGGGPGSATTFIVQFIYQTGFAEQIQMYGLAAAASIILAGGLVVLTIIQLKLSNAEKAGQKVR